MLPRAEQKLQTRQALLDAACQLMESGRGFGSISLREVAKAAGIVPTGFYRHFPDMDALGLALVAEVDDTFRQTIRLVRQNEFELGGITDASVRIFLDVVAAHRAQFLFLAREQYGGSQAVRQAIGRLRQGISNDLATDLARMKRWQHLNDAALAVIADLVVKTVFATLPELIDNPEQGYPQALSARDKITQQLRFIFVGARHWQGLGNPG
ncbi:MULTISPECIES: TetR family transcriptional regulator [Pseudomonas]|jgi:AcrR family transcriptional regulator|uniref:Transcriptional regulator, TetR family n=1 Tax=Pseudomonas putida (strain W619) TaxID=390235 RepID=B1J640_PSEPW|nr:MULTISPECIES: TetR family transcriptional regulator [Pseudomonas]MDH1575787.1 TetR family transcriptional regulator [Pseudomonas sp. GD03746]QQE83574.1 TetR family transcriptional regulator [Pseudomonas putida]UTL80723.1 TetR family transcriptional regulator [Pseudomonas putida]HEN8713910.1 TetR family transcriptional regulator [Pseudomonas putida]HEN8718227.1 TetR family transcriptional regulator [Pseudomonas putida]